MSRSARTAFVFAALIAVSGIAACSSNSTEETPPPSSCEVAIERFKELMVVEESVVGDPRSSNLRNGPWSFRHAVEAMVPAGTTPSQFLTTWFDDWASTKTVNGFETNREPRDAAMRERLVCPWLRATPANGCDELCANCMGRVLDPAKAPFRLLAIANRMDLRTHPGATGPAGEGRLVFGLMSGPADDPASKPLPMSLIFEYALPRSATPSEWAAAWHRLGAHKAFDEAYKVELEALTERFVARGVSPERVNGSALAQARTNESAFNWIWQLRQFELDSSGSLRLAPVTNTPGEPLNNTTSLRDFVVANREQVLKGVHVLPRSMTAGSADFLYRWNVPDVDPALRMAFAKETCNGCHTTENVPVDTAFHVSPFRTGIAKLSPFVYNPADPAHDDLAMREASMRRALCTNQ